MHDSNPNATMAIITMSGIVDGERLLLKQWFRPPTPDEAEKALALAVSLGAKRVRISRSNVPVPF